MRLPSLLFLSFALGINAQQLGCPTSTEPACFDVINNSLCLSQNAATGTPQVLAKCVEYEMGVGMSDLPGGVKLCRCPGCHSASVNEGIVKNFPAPCA